MARHLSGDDGQSPNDILSALQREAVIAGGRDVVLVDRVHAAWASLTRSRSAHDGPLADDEKNAIPVRRDVEKESLAEATSAFTRHLARKIRWAPAPGSLASKASSRR